jgi:UDP-N-acetylmuramate dehydrogenase
VKGKDVLGDDSPDAALFYLSIDMTIQENVPLAPLTTLKVGGEARYFAEIRREDEIAQAIEFSRSRAVPVFVLGGGSNLVVADTGFPGVVLRIAIGGIVSPTAEEATGSAVLFSVGAGVVWDDFVAQTVSQNCAGLECLSGIPGSVGGTPVQNVGAYGQEVAETIESVRAFDLKDNRIVFLPKPACGFRYRSSMFNSTQRDRHVILRVNYRLKRGGLPSLKYADIRKYFAEKNSAGGRAEKSSPSLAEVRDAVLTIRRRKGMLIVPGDDDCRSAGSFFKNPVLSDEQLKDLTSRVTAEGLTIPNYPALDAQHKIPAAWLVEHSGFAKGYVSGNTGISSKHALALINRGDARASDIIHLQDEIQRGVKAKWGILLEPEPVFVGFKGIP